MEQRPLTRWLALLLCACVAQPAAASQPAGAQTETVDPANGYYTGKAQGWFWREIEPLPPEPEADEETVAPEPQPAPPASEPLKPLSPAWLRENLPIYRDKALENPTTENIRAYFLLQRYGMDMAERFALKAQSVVLSDAILDENNRRPTSTYGADVFDAVSQQATEDLAKKIVSEAGIWYFYRSDCPYCKAMNPVLKRLANRIGITVLPVALDGKPMPDGSFPQFVPDRGHAEQLKVTQTPTLFLMKAPNEFVPLSEGLLTDEGLINRIVTAAHEAGWISDAEYNATRPVKSSTLMVDGQLPPDGTAIDPDQLAQLLKMSTE